MTPTATDRASPDKREFVLRETVAASEAATGEYLADQLLLPMALAGGGSFTTLPPSRHTMTNIEIIKKFLDIEIIAEQMAHRVWKIEVGK